MFRTLPRELYDEDFNRRMLQGEYHQFSSIMQRALTSRNMKDLATRSFNLPYSLVLETQALRQVHASNVLLALIFGQTFQEKSKPGELIRSKGSKYPIYLHLNSVDRIVELLAIDDVQFSIYHDYKTEYTYNFCAYSVIGFCDNSMRMLKAYAFDEDAHTIQ